MRARPRRRSLQHGHYPSFHGEAGLQTRGQAEGAPGEAGRLPVPRRAAATSSTSARRSRCGRACAATSRPAPDTRSTIAQLPGARRRRRGDRHRHRGRGAAPRAEPRQAPPAAVQRAAARRQVVPVHRRHRRGRVPARHVHARAPPARRRLLRAVREREEGARDARRPQPRLPVPALRGAEAGPPLRHPVPRLPHRPLPRPVRRLRLEGGLPGDDRRRDRVPLGRDASRSSAQLERGCARRPRRSASRRPRATATGCSRCGTWPSARRPTSAPSATIDVLGIADRRRPRGRAGLPAARREADRPLRVPPRERRGAGRRPRCSRRSALEYYGSAPSVPPQIVVPREAGDTSALEEFLSERRGSRVEVRARRAGREAAARRSSRPRTRGSRSSRRPRRPSRSGSAASRRSRSCARRSTSRACRSGSSASTSRTSRRPVAGRLDGRVPGRRAEEGALPQVRRRARCDGQDDFAAMAEVVSRRFARHARTSPTSEYDESFAATPNLVVIDGGKGQLSAALAAMQAFDLPRVAVIALAKREEEVFVPGPARPDRARPALARAPAPAADPRRGAPLRARLPPPAPRRAARESIFDTLQGVGPARRRALLRHFGSAERVPGGDAGGARGRAGSAGEDGALDLRAAAQGGSRVSLRAPWRRALRLLRPRNFGPYFFGNALSASGTWFQNLAAAVLIYRLTHSAVPARRAPVRPVRADPAARAVDRSAADRFDRRRLLLTTQAAHDRAHGDAGRPGVRGRCDGTSSSGSPSRSASSPPSRCPAPQALLASLVERGRPPVCGAR